VASILGTLLAVALALGTAQGARAQDGGFDLSRPLALEDLQRIAVERNLGLAQSEANVAIARGTATRAWSGLLPSANARLAYRQTTYKYDSAVVDPNTGRPVSGSFQDNFSLGADGGVNLVDLPSWYNLRAAQRSLSAARFGHEDARSLLRLNVTQQYYALIRAQQLAAVAREAYTLNQDQLRRSQSLFELGSVARSDVLQAQVNLATSERERLATENQIEVERSRLALLLGLPVQSAVQVQEPPPVTDFPAVGDEEELIARAHRQRPDVRRTEASLRAAEASEAAARWQRLPSLGAGYSYFKEADDLGGSLQRLNRNAQWGFNVGLSLNIFDGLNMEGGMQQATARRRQDERALEESRLQAALDIREAALSIRNASEEIRSAREGVTFAEESVRLQRALYENGGGTLLEWNNAQVELTRARVAVVEAEVQLRLAQAQLERALGETN